MARPVIAAWFFLVCSVGANRSACLRLREKLATENFECATAAAPAADISAVLESCRIARVFAPDLAACAADIRRSGRAGEERVLTLVNDKPVDAFFAIAYPPPNSSIVRSEGWIPVPAGRSRTVRIYTASNSTVECVSVFGDPEADPPFLNRQGTRGQCVHVSEAFQATAETCHANHHGYAWVAPMYSALI
eukprot:Polyplicarium_translucidae@DN1875_c0_g1_i1.p1